MARICEAQAAQEGDDSQRVILYKKAAAAHHELGSYREEVRCLSLACSLLEGEERVDCLVSRWGVLINALAVYRYETSFEWKGEDANLDSSYGETIEGYYNGAVDTLDEVLRMEGVNREKLLEKLYAECVRRRSEGGWGADECFSSINEFFKRRRLHV
jgi:hypothetical protein